MSCHIFNSLAKLHLEALDDMIDKEEGELEEDDDDDEEEGQNLCNDLQRKLIEDELSGSDAELSVFILKIFRVLL